MALVSSGTLYLGRDEVADATRSIAAELGRIAMQETSLGDSTVRTLGQKPSGEIKMSDFYGKSNAPSICVAMTLIGALSPCGRGIQGTMYVDSNLFTTATGVYNDSSCTDCAAGLYWAPNKAKVALDLVNYDCGSGQTVSCLEERI